MRSAVIALCLSLIVAGAIAYAETVDDGFVAYEENSTEGTTYIEPGAIVFEGPEGPSHGFVELCHYPDEFLMVSGGLLVESGMRGLRVAGPDGGPAAYVAADETNAYLSALPDYAENPRSLALYAGADFVLNMPAAEDNGSLRVVLNGRPVLISFVEE